MIKNLLKLIIIGGFSTLVYGNILFPSTDLLNTVPLDRELSEKELLLEQLMFENREPTLIFTIKEDPNKKKEELIDDKIVAEGDTISSTTEETTSSAEEILGNHLAPNQFEIKLKTPKEGDPRPATMGTIEDIVDYELVRERAAAMLEYYNEFFETYLDTISFDATRIYDLGNYYFKNRKYEKAIAVFSKNTELPENLFGLATSQRFLGKTSVAITNYTKIIDLKPSLAEPYLGRGICYRDQGKYREALADFLKYKSMRNTEEAYAALGNIYLLRKDYSNAKFVLNDGKMLYPSSEVINNLLVKAYVKR